MNSKITIIIPEKDIDLRLVRFLIIIDTLAYTQRGKLVISIDKLIIFDFLVKYPFILKSVLKVKDKRSNLKLSKTEVRSIETLFPSKSALLDINSAKILIKLMISYDLISVKVDKSELFYIPSDTGKIFINDIDTDYINRIRDLCEAMLVMRSIRTNELKEMIKPLIRGV